MAEKMTEVQVVRNEDEERFEATVDGQLAVLTYADMDGKLYLLHTGVPEELEGRGLGGRLVKYALDHARADGVKVVPSCPFAHAYVERHPEYRDLIASPD